MPTSSSSLVLHCIRLYELSHHDHAQFCLNLPLVFRRMRPLCRILNSYFILILILRNDLESVVIMINRSVVRG